MTSPLHGFVPYSSVKRKQNNHFIIKNNNFTIAKNQGVQMLQLLWQLQFLWISM